MAFTGRQLVILTYFMLVVQICTSQDEKMIENTKSLVFNCAAGEAVNVQYYSSYCSSSDAMKYIRKTCSMESTCSITPTDIVQNVATIDQTFMDNCQDDSVRISYTCAKIIECSCTGVVTVDAVARYYIVRSGSPCGQPACPLRMKARQGHGYDINAYDLTYSGNIQSQTSTEDLTSAELNSCTYSINYQIPDGANSRYICGGHSYTQGDYATDDNVPILDVTWDHSNSLDFEILFTVEGCPNPMIPQHGWMARIEDSKVAFGCYFSESAWSAECQDHRGFLWDGVTGVCPAASCPDVSDLDGNANTACTSAQVSTYKDGNKIGCCNKASSLTLCSDGSMSIAKTFVGCPSGFYSAYLNSNSRCCPLYGKHPDCPFGQYSVALSGDSCPADSTMVYMQTDDRFWIGCCTETPDDEDCPETCPTDPSDPNNNGNNGNKNNGNKNNGNNNNGNNNNGNNNNGNNNNNSTNNNDNNYSPRVSSSVLTWSSLLLVCRLIAGML